jgi:methionyl-tRNA formyltransferase
MRWVLCGKNDAACRILHFLHERGDEIWALATVSDDGIDGWQPSFRARCEALAIPSDQPANINSADLVQRLIDYRPTALISVQYDQILRKSLFEAVDFPCLNLHFALLPRHRGVAPIAWAILDGDEQAGVTLHHMTPGIDAGDIVTQRSVPITPTDNARSVYDMVSDATVALFKDCYPFPASLLDARSVQAEEQAVYHRNGDLDFSRHLIDWQTDAQELQRWIRAMIFPPLQLPELCWQGRQHRVTRVDADLPAATGQPPGTVIENDGEWCTVATSTGAIRISGVIDPLTGIDITDQLAPKTSLATDLTEDSNP